MAAAVVLAGASSAARAQVATLDKGHSLFLNNGLGIWGFDSDTRYAFDYNTLAAGNMNAVVWGNGGTDMSTLSAGQKWGKWTDWQYNGTTVTPQTALTADELAHKNDLVAMQIGDEVNQSDMETGSQTKNWLLAAGNGTATTSDDVYPNTLLYTNSFFINNDANYANFLTTANPDAISWDSYPFSNPAGHYITPTNWLSLGQTFRRHGLGSYIGATGASPRPYGMYVQTYHDDFAVDPGEAQIRWQQFAAWTMGYSWVDAFIYDGGNNNFSTSAGVPNSVYENFKETARQGRNLGPALVRLISYSNGPGGGGTSIIPGKNSDGSNRGVPGGWQVFNQNDAPPNQRYLTGVSATNLGTKNGGFAGDVYVGFFNPLLTTLGDPAGEAYFMVTNGLGGDLTLPGGSADNTATAAETQQQLTLSFDNNYSGVTTLQRLRRSDGQVEIVPLTRTGNNTYQTTITLDGGTGDLLKYNDGTPLVGINTTLYWDGDANAANNNAGTGAGLGGTGTWDSASARWYNGASNAAWAAPRDAVFTGSAGTVSLTSPQQVNSLSFKTTGYAVGGTSALTLAGQFVTTDSGVTATISAPLAGTGGLAKTGSGTLILSGTNTYSGGTTILGGTLRVSSDANLGAAPASLSQDITLNGGTLQFGANFDINNNRAIALGPNGGTIDTQQFSNPSGYNATNGGFRGPGDLIKTGTGTFFAAATTGGLNTTWKGRLILKQGTWKIVASDGLPYNVPLADGLKADQIILDGGTWQAGAALNITSARRGITVTANGGAIDTQGFSFSWAGPLAGSSTSAVLTKTGTGTLHLTGASFASTYAGTVYVIGGTLELNGGISMGDTANILLGGGNLVVTGNETIGSVGGAGSVTLSNGIVLTTGGNNTSTTQSGGIIGLGGLTKGGTGTFGLAGVNTYTGPTTVNGGVLLIPHSLTTSTSLTVNDGAVARVTAGGSNVVKTGSVTTSGSGTLDLKDNKAVLTAQAVGTWNGSSYTGVTALVASGRNGGSSNWAGSGITTTMSAAASDYTELGTARASEVLGIGSSATTTWTGQTVHGSDTLVMYTYGGDANLDGLINIDDYTQIDSSVSAGGALKGWYNGDFNYDGEVNIDDYTIIDSNIGVQGAPFSTAAAMGSSMAVPEPGVMTSMIIAAASLLAGRRRRAER